MDYEVGTCKNCGGILSYIHCLDKISCDTCEGEDQKEQDNDWVQVPLSEDAKNKLIKMHELHMLSLQRQGRHNRS